MQIKGKNHALDAQSDKHIDELTPFTIRALGDQEEGDAPTCYLIKAHRHRQKAQSSRLRQSAGSVSGGGDAPSRLTPPRGTEAGPRLRRATRITSEGTSEDAQTGLRTRRKQRPCIQRARVATDSRVVNITLSFCTPGGKDAVHLSSTHKCEEST